MERFDVEQGGLSVVKLTKAQQRSVCSLWRRSSGDRTYREFRRSVFPMIGGDGAVVVRWAGMWLAVETDGYTHS